MLAIIKMKIQKTLPLLLGVGGLLVGLILICMQAFETTPDVEQFHGTWVEPARSVDPFQFEGIDHQAFTPAQLKGQWTWLFFGFTTCPDLCPTTMAKLANTYQQLKKRGVQPLPRIMMVTLDPSQDTIAKLEQYVHQFDQDFYGARGEEKQVSSLARALGVAYMRSVTKQSQEKAVSHIDHSGVVMVVNPAGQLQAFFNPPFSVADLVDNHQVLIHQK